MKSPAGQDLLPPREGNLPAGVVSIERCRAILGPSANDWPDADVLSLRERLAYLADLAIELAEEEVAA